MSIEQIRKSRGVPAKIGGRVRYTGGDKPKLGTIVSTSVGYLRIRLDGEKHLGNYHPTWKLEYLGIKKRILHLHLKYKWFDQIASGEKSCEMRLATERWRKRLIGQHYDEIHLYRAYPKREDYDKETRLIRKWTCVAKETVKHEEFGDEPVEVFVIDVSQEVSP